jgi:type IV pilus assembly protein PilC
MPTFTFTAMDANGEEQSGTVEASSQSQALAAIREQGLFPTEVQEAGAAGGAAVSPARSKPAAKAGKGKSKASAKGKPKSALQMELRLPSFMQRVKPKQLMTYTRQLATLINAGLPLMRGLQVILKQEKHPLLRKATADIVESIQTGSTFAEALAQHPKVFNRLYINMVKAGELGGVMDVVLERLAEFMEKAQRIKNKVVSAMVYPIVVLIMALGILTFLMIVIIPKFEAIFDDLLGEGGLPVLTEVVLNISRTFATRAPFVLVGIVVFVVVLKLLKRTSWGRFGSDWFKLHTPIFGVLLSKTAIARFTRTLGTLMTSGVPVLQALNIVRDTSGNEVIARAVTTIHDSVKEGENMAPPIQASGVFPPMVVSMVEVGEETGELPEMLMKIADNYDDEVDNTVAGLTSIIEPLLIVFLALIVGTIVIALFLPLVSIIGSIGS